MKKATETEQVTLISFYNNKLNRKGLNSNQKLHKVKTYNNKRNRMGLNSNQQLHKVKTINQLDEKGKWNGK